MMKLNGLNFHQVFWKILLKIALIFSISWGVFTSPVMGGSISPSVVDLAHQPLREIPVSLGNEKGELRFYPNHLELEVGKRYKLHLTNPSPVKHYFTAKDFADAVWTQKVDAGNVEIKGAIRELELRPGSQADWVIVPIRPGIYNLRCTIPGHTEAGMTGEIRIKTS